VYRFFAMCFLLSGGYLFSSYSHAAAPTCQLTSTGSPYCSYVGKVDKVYINSGGLILLYFDTPLILADAEAVGYSPTNTKATAYLVSENPDFAKLFYSTALAAQASGRSVTIQMRGTHGSYLKFDRIWLNE
jgi:hypothetical protein